MSAFCIHAVSRNQILTAAKRQVESLYQSERGRYQRRMSESEWEMAVGFRAAAMHAKAKPAAVSPKFDAPTFAQTWAALAVKSGDIEGYTLMAYTPTGQIHPKTKMPICEWRMYRPMAIQEAA